MAIVFAAFTPHSPLLLPTIGKTHRHKLAHTLEALREVERALYVAKPDTLLVISSHGRFFPDAFVLNCGDPLRTNFQEFGDVQTSDRLRCDMSLASNIREEAKRARLPVEIQTDLFLDYGAAVPLHLLTGHLPHIKALPLSPAGLDLKTHFDFGYFLKDLLTNRASRIAVIATGDLSHALSSHSPGGFAKEGAVYDAKIQELITAGGTTALLGFEETFLAQAAECSARSLAILFGILNHTHSTVRILSYEAPLNVGMLTALFEFR